MASFTIGETSRRSGFSPSTLRFYEDIGLVAPAGRTASGYRQYDHDALERLAFVARAKQLGCSLDEITELLTVVAADDCAPVQRRLHELVTAKLAAAERQLEELTVLTGQLRRAASLLGGSADEGPCSPTCACSTAPVLLGGRRGR